jgi:hypothetical protein
MRTLRTMGNLKTVQRLLGHSDVATTSRFYVDASIEGRARRNGSDNRVNSGRGKDGKQLVRQIGPRTVNRTVTLLVRRIMRRAVKAWDAVVFREPNWTDHLLSEPKRAIREISVRRLWAKLACDATTNPNR